ncbi:LysE family translocator [Nocardia sp. NPDC052254]|uniref:LysE family translocator n=1 Tax=Nocardia sp. NPDC052254 TaxID=3155681 RepID=UPI0034413875
MDLIPFVLAAILGAILPGPDFAVVTRYSTIDGLRAGVIAALGITCGMAVNTTIAVIGIGATVASAPGAFTVVRVAGAGYLLFLGAKLLLSLSKSVREATLGDQPAMSQPAPFRRGFLVNATNPKAILFLVALMAHFLPAGSPLLRKVELGVLMVAPVLVWMLVVAVGFSRLQPVFVRPRNRRLMDAATAAVFIVLGIQVAVGDLPVPEFDAASDRSTELIGSLYEIREPDPG